MQTSTAKPKLASLEVFDARIVQTPIHGLLTVPIEKTDETGRAK